MPTTAHNKILRAAAVLAVASASNCTCSESEEPATAAATATVPPRAPARPRVADPIPAPHDVAEPPPDAVRLASGLFYKVMHAGTGTTHPRPDDVIVTEYTGWTPDGAMISSTRAYGEPSIFRLGLDGILPGWKEGIALMVAGETRRFWIPEGLAYKGAANQPKGMVVFEIELVSIQAATGIVAPIDVAEAPPDATRTGSGLAYRILTPGSGTEHPEVGGEVAVTFTGWTHDGKMIATSSSTADSITLHLGTEEVMPGVGEGLQLMVAGEKRRLWIPEKLAYPGDPRAPKGLLVYDIELVSLL